MPAKARATRTGSKPLTDREVFNLADDLLEAVDRETRPLHPGDKRDSLCRLRAKIDMALTERIERLPQ